MIRIVCAFFISFSKPFSLLFWILYILGGISDILDGLIARHLKQESEFGAKLDSIADFIFLIGVFASILPTLVLPLWVLVCIIIVAFIRILSYMIALKKYHTFISLHTYANKLTGLLLFIMPILYVIFDFNITIIILGISAIVSALEEIIIVIKSKDIDINCKSIFVVIYNK